MPTRLPPLNAVRAFAVAARHQSFTRAAQELNVTHGAVSRQIRALEDHLGASLFERGVRQVRLTLAGQQFFAEVAPALDQIATAAQALTARSPARTVRIDVRPSFAVGWLIPRLPSFVAQYPGIEPEVVTSTVTPDRATERFDVAIRRGTAGWPSSIDVRPFLHDEALVVGAPAMFAARPVAQPRDLGGHVLLSSRTRQQDWDDWKRHTGTLRLKPANRLQFDHLHFVLRAAVDGLGFALGPATLVAPDLAVGRLQCPLPALRLPLTRHYYGLAPDAVPEAQCVVAWLEAELAAERTAPATASGQRAG